MQDHLTPAQDMGRYRYTPQPPRSLRCQNRHHQRKRTQSLQRSVQRIGRLDRIWISDYHLVHSQRNGSPIHFSVLIVIAATSATVIAWHRLLSKRNPVSLDQVPRYHFQSLYQDARKSMMKPMEVKEQAAIRKDLQTRQHPRRGTGGIVLIRILPCQVHHPAQSQSQAPKANQKKVDAPRN